MPLLNPISEESMPIKSIDMKSKYTSTISFTVESFANMMAKDFDQVECNMVDGTVITISRSDLTMMWARERKFKTTRHGLPIKVLKVR